MARGNFSSDAEWFRTTTLPSFPYTISGWAYCAGLGSLVILQDEGGALDATGVALTTGNIVTAYELNAGAVSGSGAVTSTSTSLNAWFHFAGVFSGDASRDAFLNGGGKGSNTVNNGADQSLYDSLIVGGRNIAAPGERLNGYLAEVGIWDVALSDAEIASLGKGFSCHLIRAASLIHHMPLVRGGQDFRGNLAETGTIGVFSHPPIIGAIAA